MTKAGQKSICQQSLPNVSACAAGPDQRWRVAGLCLVLAGITFAVFGQTAGFQFVSYDDNKYVYENPMVAKGLTLKGFVWALSYGEIGHWHPLTWLSHMLDCQIFGLWAGGPHLINVTLHAMAAALLFLALREMTGSLWRSAFVAAVFAIHPLRVESVAWIAERKDVLSGVFFMLTLWAYARYARRPSPGRYVVVAVLYGLGLLCKNTVVTLPFVLLLLDWWPLQRVTLFWGLVREKIPLFLLSAGSCAATFLVPEKASDIYRLSFLERFGNAVVSYGVYIWQMVFPTGLAIPYLNAPNSLPFWKVALVFVLLAAISITVWACRKCRPYLLVGWLWYLGMLIPAIGIVQISYYVRADRYTYLPGIGLGLAGTWAVGDWSAGWKHRRAVMGGLMTTVIGALMVCAWIQTGYWKSTETLWTHTLACAPENYVAHEGLGLDLLQKGRVNEAISQYQESLQIRPGYVSARINLGNALLQKGSVDEAIAAFQKALQLKPGDAEAHYNFANALLQKGQMDEAIAHYQQAVQIKPGFAEAHNNLGHALFQKGRVDDAISHFQSALQINPAFADAHNNLGEAIRQKGKLDESIEQFQQALQIKPDFAEAHYNLGIALRQTGKIDEAIAQYQSALQINPALAEARLKLGIALFQKGQVDEAVAQYRKALQFKPGIADAYGNLGIALFQKGQMDEAVSQFRIALQIKPNDAEAHYNLGNALCQTGRVDEAIPHLQTALQIKPGHAPAHFCLGNAFSQKGRMDEAIAEYKEALQLDPANPVVQNTLAWLLATSPQASIRNGPKAVALARQVNELAGGKNPIYLRTLAAAFAEVGQFNDARQVTQKAIVLVRAAGRDDMAQDLNNDLKRYEAGLPFHQ
jgi:tetratricopeptide (TPR) repeat protein